MEKASTELLNILVIFFSANCNCGIEGVKRHSRIIGGKNVTKVKINNQIHESLRDGLKKTSTKFVHSCVIQTKSNKFKQSQFLEIS